MVLQQSFILLIIYGIFVYISYDAVVRAADYPQYNIDTPREKLKFDAQDKIYKEKLEREIQSHPGKSILST